MVAGSSPAGGLKNTLEYMLDVYYFEVELDPNTEESQEDWETGDIVYF